MENYKPNSHKYKEENKQLPATTEEKPKVEKVITGKVKTKKKSQVTKFADIFISEDAANVKSYVFMDVLVPAIKKAISDIVTDGIDMILYGGTGQSRKRSGGSNATYVSYRNYSDRDRRDDRRRDDGYRSRSRYSFEDIILDNRADAEEVLDRLDELLDQYSMVRVSDLYDLVGITGEYTDNKYGWTSLSTARVEPVRGGGYMLKMPNPMPIGR